MTPQPAPAGAPGAPPPPAGAAREDGARRTADDAKRARLFALRAELCAPARATRRRGRAPLTRPCARVRRFAADPDFKAKSLQVLNSEALAHLAAGDDARCVAAFAKLFRKARENNCGHPQLYGAHNNRAKAYLNLGLYEEALWDARAAGRLAEARFHALGGAGALGRGGPAAGEARAAIDAFARALERRGWALLGMGAPRAARAAFEQGLEVQPGGSELRRGCEESARALLGDLLAGRSTMPLALPAPAAGGDRITLLPAASPLHRVQASQLLPSRLLSPFQAQSDHALRDSYNYATVQADIQLPKRQFAVLADGARAAAWEEALRAAVAALAEDERDARVLVLGAGGGAGLLPLLALRAGVKHVTCAERWLYLATGAKESLAANGVDPGRFDVVYKRPTDLQLRADVPVACNLLVADVLEDGLLSAGLIPAVRHALQSLCLPDAIVLPSSVAVFAQPLELRCESVRGYDVSACNLWRWEAGHSSGKPLSPFLVSDPAADGSRCIPLAAPVAVWHFDMLTPPDACESKLVDLAFDSSGRFNAVRFWFELALGASGAVLSTAPEGLQRPGSIRLSHMHPALQYLPGELAVAAGATLPLRCSHNTVAMRFDLEAEEYVHLYGADASVPPAALHALADTATAAAYEAAIGRAVARRRAAGEPARVLDVGTGSGLLAMMAAKAGAASVVAVDIHERWATTARRNVAANGLASRVSVLCADAGCLERGRHLSSDGANVVLFDLFDPGLLGDRIVPLLAQLRRSVLEKGAQPVPAAATVYAVGLEVRTPCVAGFDFSAFDKYRWEPGYEGVRLDALPHRVLTKPRRVFETFFDGGGGEGLQEGLLKFEVVADGLLNAVAFWFDLHLDEESSITSAPAAWGLGGEPAAEPEPAAAAPPPRAGGCWGQALQMLERAVAVEAGGRQTVLFRVEAERLSFELKVTDGDWVDKPPWRITWGGGASVESPHFQRVHYCQLLVSEFLMRVRCRRFPPIEKEMRTVLAHCGSLFLDPEALAAAFRHLVTLERLQLTEELSPLASAEAVAKPHVFLA